MPGQTTQLEQDCAVPLTKLQSRALRVVAVYMPRLLLLELGLLFALSGCGSQRKLDNVILSYSEASGSCMSCPNFRVDLRKGGYVNFECLSACAVPGEQHYLVPARRFEELARAFSDAHFFNVARTDPKKMPTDVAVFRLAYRDERRIHEVIDGLRNIPQISGLEERMRIATEVDRYLTPSVALYRRLLDSGWNINTLGNDGQNALCAAVKLRDLGSTRFLVQHGSKVTDETLAAAALSQNVEILRLVLEASQLKLLEQRGADMLSDAARFPKTDLVQFLLNSGAQANSHGHGLGETPLASALICGSFDNAQLLLKNGADVNARDRNGRTALMWVAAAAVNTRAITMLLEHGADVNARDSEGRTALMHAADLCSTWNLKALLDAGADPAIEDKHGRTALEQNSASVGDPKCATARKMIAAGGTLLH